MSHGRFDVIAELQSLFPVQQDGKYLLWSQTGTTSDALGTLLDNDDIKLDDINFSRYLRLMLSQKTGWNMRNLYCHGLSESFGMPHADRVFHIILLMATLLLPD